MSENNLYRINDSFFCLATSVASAIHMFNMYYGEDHKDIKSVILNFSGIITDKEVNEKIKERNS